MARRSTSSTDSTSTRAGDVYFIDSSATYPRRFNTEIMMTADAKGRLLKYDARTK